MSICLIPSIRSIALLAGLLLAANVSGATEPPVDGWRPWLPETRESPMPTLQDPFVLPDEQAGWTLPAGVEALPGTPSALEWTERTIDMVRKYQRNPLRAARALALVSVTVHDATLSAALAGLSPPGQDAAAHAGAARTLDYLFPQESWARIDALGLSAARRATGGSTKDFRLAWYIGRRVAGAAIARALDDGADRPVDIFSRPEAVAGIWRAAPPLNTHTPLEPNAGHWRTWVLRDGGEVQPPAPPAYGSPIYLEELEEVVRVQRGLTAEQKEAAERWNLDRGTATPPGVWNLLAAEAARRHALSARAAARMMASLNVAMHDAMVACWHAKFRWWSERPVTVIRRELDPEFLPFLLTPPFPAYPSGHACASGAAFEILASFFPGEREALLSHAQEAASSRLWGGIHFASDNSRGLELGREIGRRTLARVAAPEPATATPARRD